MNFGIAKIVLDRAAIYASRVITLVNFGLLINLSVQSGMDIWQYVPWAIVGFVAFILVVIFDMVVIYPQEVSYRDGRSKIMKSIYDKIVEGENK